MGYQSEDIFKDETTPAPAQSGYDEGRAKKNLHFAFFVILCILAGLAAFFAFLNFCISLSQVTSQTDLANGTTIWAKDEYSCDDVKQFWPLRWEFEVQPDVEMMCPWPVGNSAFRCLISIFGMGTIAFFIFVLRKPDVPWLNWGFLSLDAFITVMFFIILCVDGSALHKGTNYCEDGMPEAAVHFKPELKVKDSFGIGCFPGPFVGLVFVDVLVMLAFPGLAAYFFFYHRRSHMTGNPQIPDDADENQPLTRAQAPAPKRKVFVASAIKDDSLTQDVTGANPFDPRTGMVDPNSA